MHMQQSKTKTEPMVLNEQNIRTLFYELHREYEEDEDDIYPAPEEMEDRILEHLEDDHRVVRFCIAFHHYVRRIIHEIMESDEYEEYLKETQRLIDEIEYEKRHPYKYRGVSRGMF